MNEITQNHRNFTQTEAGVIITLAIVLGILTLVLWLYAERRWGEERVALIVRRAKQLAWISGGVLVGCLCLFVVTYSIFRSPNRLEKIQESFKGALNRFEFEVPKLEPGGKLSPHPKIVFLEWDNSVPQKQLPDDAADYRKSVSMRQIAGEILAQQPDEVNTVILIRKGYHRVNSYTDGTGAFHRIHEWNVLEFPARRLIAQRTFGGGMPPKTTQTGISGVGSDPNPDRMRQWLDDVLRTGTDALAGMSVDANGLIRGASPIQDQPERDP